MSLPQLQPLFDFILVAKLSTMPREQCIPYVTDLLITNMITQEQYARLLAVLQAE